MKKKIKRTLSFSSEKNNKNQEKNFPPFIKGGRGILRHDVKIY
jgi:hypothetical protein